MNGKLRYNSVKQRKILRGIKRNNGGENDGKLNEKKNIE